MVGTGIVPLSCCHNSLFSPFWPHRCLNGTAAETTFFYSARDPQWSLRSLVDDDSRVILGGPAKRFSSTPRSAANLERSGKFVRQQRLVMPLHVDGSHL